MELVMQSFDLMKAMETVHRAVKLHAESSLVIVSFRHTNELPAAVLGDRQRFQHAFINILTHFINLTPEQSSITIITSVELITNNTTNARIAKLKFMLDARNISLSSDNIASMFQPFCALRSHESQIESGTGLGLALARDIIELHGGNLEYEFQSINTFGSKNITFGFAIPFVVPDVHPPLGSPPSVTPTRIKYLSNNFTFDVVGTEDDEVRSITPSSEIYCLVVDGKDLVFIYFNANDSHIINN